MALLIMVFGLFIGSCKKDETTTTTNSYYVSSETKLSLTIANIRTDLQKFIPGFNLGSLVTSDVDVQKLVYKTTFKNNSIKASGLVCFPKNPGNYPILSFQNGTITKFTEAPTENIDDETIKMIESVASTGFIVVIPDYIGFGESASLPHPYLDAKSSNQSILDMLRAVKELGNDAKTEAKPTKDLYLFGYSQGGWATLQLQKSIETNYSSEFNLIASSCGSGPYSLEYMTDYILSKDIYPMPYFFAYVLNSYSAIGTITNPLSDYFQAPYAAKIPGLFDGMHSGGAINAELNTQVSSLLTSDFRTGYSTNSKFAVFKSAIKSNTVEAWSLSTPTKLFHGGADDYIPAGVSQKMQADFLAKDSNNSKKLEVTIIPGVDHSSAISPVSLLTLSWFLQIKK